MKLFWFFQSGSKSSQNRAGVSDPLEIAGLRIIVWMAFLVLLVFGAWASWAKLDQVTRASGPVIPSSKTQIIQSQDGGIIESLMVHEGATVEAGQVLLRFEKTRSEAGYLEARAKYAALLATVARLHAEVLDKPIQYPKALDAYPEFKSSQTDLYNKRKAALSEEISSVQDLVRLVQEELNMTEPLLKSGDVSKTEVLRLQRQVSELKSQISNKRNKYFQDAQAELNKAQEDLASIEQNMAQRKNQLELTELKAPLKGVVKNIRITTIGGVIRPGEEVMQIVPLEDDLLIQAKVSPADIAFLKIGQDVRVKIDAFDYTIYGDLPGKLVYISADTLNEDLKQGETPYFRAQVRTLGRKFSGRVDENLDIQPGMTATIEVKTGERTVLQYLLKPVVKTLSQSLGER
jgi:adhesin transport system membrane fusion protein